MEVESRRQADAAEVGGPSDRQIVALLRTPYLAALEVVAASLRVDFPELRPAHLIVFQLLDRPTSGSRLTDLARRAQRTKPSMLELVDALERSGYVERLPDPTDRRAKLIRFTAQGWAVDGRARAIVAAMHATWGARLGSERWAQLLGLLRDLNDVVEGVNTNPAAGGTPPARTRPIHS